MSTSCEHILAGRSVRLRATTCRHGPTTTSVQDRCHRHAGTPPCQPSCRLVLPPEAAPGPAPNPLAQMPAPTRFCSCAGGGWRGVNRKRKYGAVTHGLSSGNGRIYCRLGQTLRKRGSRPKRNIPRNGITWVRPGREPAKLKEKGRVHGGHVDR